MAPELLKANTGSNMSLVSKLKKLEGYAGLLKKTTKFTGLTGTPNSRVAGSSKHGFYYDSKGKLTTGFGDLVETMEEASEKLFLTEDKANEGLQKHIQEKQQLLKKLIPGVDSLNPRLRNALLVETFRGSVPQSKKTISKINKGNLLEAAKEFLNNAEYRSEGTSSGIKSRMLEVSEAIKEQHQSNMERKQEEFNQGAREAQELEVRSQEQKQQDFNKKAMGILESRKIKRKLVS